MHGPRKGAAPVTSARIRAKAWPNPLPHARAAAAASMGHRRTAAPARTKRAAGYANPLPSFALAYLSLGNAPLDILDMALSMFERFAAFRSMVVFFGCFMIAIVSWIVSDREARRGRGGGGGFVSMSRCVASDE